MCKEIKSPFNYSLHSVSTNYYTFLDMPTYVCVCIHIHTHNLSTIFLTGHCTGTQEIKYKRKLVTHNFGKVISTIIIKSPLKR